MRVNHEYGRGGALAYLAAYDVQQANVIGRCEATTGIVPFMNLVEQVMTIEPYASAERVFWVVDNGSSHRGKKAIEHLAARFRTLSSSIPRYTRPGRTKSRSTSPSFSARSSHPTTSPA
jgi:hypothetical protein